jgi:hypothetical protein
MYNITFKNVQYIVKQKFAIYYLINAHFEGAQFNYHKRQNPAHFCNFFVHILRIKNFVMTTTK